MTFWTYGELGARRLTGRTRGRPGWCGKIVMQVEILSPMPSPLDIPPHPARPYDPFRYGSFTFWRDAKLGDLAELYGPKPDEVGVADERLHVA